MKRLIVSENQLERLSSVLGPQGFELVKSQVRTTRPFPKGPRTGEERAEEGEEWAGYEKNIEKVAIGLDKLMASMIGIRGNLDTINNFAESLLEPLYDITDPNGAVALRKTITGLQHIYEIIESSIQVIQKIRAQYRPGV
jgi:hypothetical protein